MPNAPMPHFDDALSGRACAEQSSEQSSGPAQTDAACASAVVPASTSPQEVFTCARASSWEEPTKRISGVQWSHPPSRAMRNLICLRPEWLAAVDVNQSTYQVDSDRQ